jgi:hypothetical protein
MGIVVDLAKSDAKFDDPLAIVDADLVMGQPLNYDMQSWVASFGIRFDPDPNQGTGGAPQDSELWDIGIVQNLLYERLLFEYARLPVLETEFTTATVDRLENDFDSPFYSAPVFDSTRFQTRAVAHIWYSSQGYGELLDPSSSSGVRTNNKPDLLDMFDQPGAGVSQQRNGSLLIRVEKVLCFQIWLVARKFGMFSHPPKLGPIQALRAAFAPVLQPASSQNTIVLAHVPAFTLRFWYNVTGPPTGGLGAGPQFAYGVYGENGFLPKKPMNHRITGLGSRPSVIPMLGDGGRRPVMTGPASIVQARNWLNKNGLHP